MLTKEQMLQILEQRKLQFEAEKYSQEVEVKVATDLGEADVVEAAQQRADYFQQAIDSVDKQIEDLGPVEPTVMDIIRNSNHNTGESDLLA